MASKRKELYDQISPLPNPVKDKIFRHLSSRRFGKSIRRRGETRSMILQSIAKEPKTVLQLMLEIDTGASTMRSHLKELNRQGLVRVVGKDKGAFQKSLRTANLWQANQNKFVFD
jgi:DNA-binding transcriptional ArsR family regulator